jgi:alpha-1,2-mannosyltransferase
MSSSALHARVKPPLLAVLKQGDWLTPDRIRNYSIILVAAYAIAIVALIATSHGGVDYAGRPIGTDFSDVWSAGRLALQGAPTSAYDPHAQFAAQQLAFHRPDIPYYGWAYPPFFLLLASLLAFLPYAVALAVWQGVTVPLYLATLRAISPRWETLLLGLAFPAVFVDLTHGQNGFFSVALMAGGLVILDRRPLVAGVLFGLLAYKPQLGLFLPLVLAVTGRWKTFASAAATVAVLMGLTAAVFGVDIWRAFIDSTHFTRTVFLEQGDTGFYKLQSAFAAVRLWGGSVQLAYAIQGGVTVASALAVTALWRSQADFRLKAAGLLAACLLATPYCLDYDLVLLAPAVAFVAAVGLERGFRPYEISVFALAFAAPISTRFIARAALIPLGLLVTAALLILILRRAFTGIDAPFLRENAGEAEADLRPALR